MAEQKTGQEIVDEFAHIFLDAKSPEELLVRLTELIPPSELNEMLRQDSLVSSAYKMIEPEELMVKAGIVFDNIMKVSREGGMSEALIQAGNLDSYYERRHQEMNAAAEKRVSLWTALGLSAVLVAVIVVVVWMQERLRSAERLDELQRLSAEICKMKDQAEDLRKQGETEINSEKQIKDVRISPLLKLAEDSLARAMKGSGGGNGSGLFSGLETILNRIRKGDIPEEVEKEVNKRLGNVLKNFRHDYPEIYEDWQTGKSGYYRVFVIGAAGLTTTAAAYVMSTNATGVYNRRKVLRQILLQRPCLRTKEYLRLI